MRGSRSPTSPARRGGPPLQKKRSAARKPIAEVRTARRTGPWTSWIILRVGCCPYLTAHKNIDWLCELLHIPLSFFSLCCLLKKSDLLCWMLQVRGRDCETCVLALGSSVLSVVKAVISCFSVCAAWYFWAVGQPGDLLCELTSTIKRTALVVHLCNRTSWRDMKTAPMIITAMFLVVWALVLTALAFAENLPQRNADLRTNAASGSVNGRISSPGLL